MKKLMIAGAMMAFAACTSVETATVAPNEVAATGGEAVAVIQANALGFTALLHTIDIVQSDLDIVTTKLLVSEAKAMGANRVDLKDVRTTPRHGIYALTGLIIGFPSSEAVGVAVK